MGGWLRHHTKSVNTWVREQLTLDAGDRLLEIGFGSGELLFELLSRNARVEAAGLDLSAEMVRLASRRMESLIRTHRVELKQGAVDAIPFGDASFSRLVSVNTLYFWPSPAAALAECQRVLADQGEILLCFDAKEELETWPGHRFGFRLYEPLEVETLVLEAGLVLVDVRTRSFPGYGKAHCVIARKEKRCLPVAGCHPRTFRNDRR